MSELHSHPEPSAPQAGSGHRATQPGTADAAQRSLADALTVSFRILTVLMVFVILVYLASGIFIVKEQQKAVRMQFGRIVGGLQPKVYDAGLHIGLPFPIEDRIIVEVVPQTVTLNRTFWYEVAAGQAGRTTAELAESGGRALNPERDGSLLTGDANVVHGRFDIGYVVDDVVRFVTNLDDPAKAEQIVLAAAERGLVHAVASTPADEVIGGRPGMDRALLRAQEVLDDLGTGIKITRFTSTSTAVPLSVFHAYQAVSNAEAEKAQQIDEARQKLARALGETAGRAYTGLYNLLREYEAAVSAENHEQMRQLEVELNQALSSLRLAEERGGAVIGGAVAQAISEAQSYRTQVVESIKAEAGTYEQLLDQYRSSPRILKNRLWQDAREEVFTGDIETIYAPTGQLYIVANPDPAVAREREESRMQLRREELRREGQNR